MKINRFVFIVSLTVLFSSCSGNKENPAREIPKNILDKANNFIVSKTGSDFFNDNFKIDYSAFKSFKGGYRLNYIFQLKDKPYIKQNISISFDSTGNILFTDEIKKIPNLKEQPEKFLFTVSKDDAIKIAENAGLEKGIKEWSVKLEWNENYGIYTWNIISTFSEFKNSAGFRSKGKEIIIDSNSGKILDTKLWQIN